jgi:hypothetical protein
MPRLTGQNCGDSAGGWVQRGWVADSCVAAGRVSPAARRPTTHHRRAGERAGREAERVQHALAVGEVQVVDGGEAGPRAVVVRLFAVVVAAPIVAAVIVAAVVALAVARADQRGV